MHIDLAVQRNYINIIPSTPTCVAVGGSSTGNMEKRERENLRLNEKREKL